MIAIFLDFLKRVPLQIAQLQQLQTLVNNITGMDENGIDRSIIIMVVSCDTNFLSLKFYRVF